MRDFPWETVVNLSNREDPEFPKKSREESWFFRDHKWDLFERHKAPVLYREILERYDQSPKLLTACAALLSYLPIRRSSTNQSLIFI